MKNHLVIQDSKNNFKKINNSKSEKTVFAEFIKIKAVGYPFDFSLMENDVEINDLELFEEYAREQWYGISVKIGSYLFDQKIIPDFGFKVIDVVPNNSVIGENTVINLIKEELPKKIIPSYNLSLDDIVGQVNAKNKSKIIMKYINNPEKFGQWAPKNILFYGLPGTGKTMLAKALAHELEVPLHLIKATSLIGNHVGDGAYKIHDLFEKSRKVTPSIIFIDEIDAIALHRSFQSLRGDVSEVVNALLTEMDGIELNDAIITIAATNNINSLDTGIRSRFEEEIEFSLPNKEERLVLFKKNLKTFPLKTDLDLNYLVKISKNMSGRDIKEKILKTALHHAIIKDKEIVDMGDIEYALNLSKINKNNVKGMFE